MILVCQKIHGEIKTLQNKNINKIFEQLYKRIIRNSSYVFDPRLDSKELP